MTVNNNLATSSDREDGTKTVACGGNKDNLTENFRGENCEVPTKVCEVCVCALI